MSKQAPMTQLLDLTYRFIRNRSKFVVEAEIIHNSTEIGTIQMENSLTVSSRYRHSRQKRDFQHV